MKKKLFSCLLFCLLLIAPRLVEAAPANSEEFSFEQPSGETFNAQTKGDEFFNYILSENGYVIEKAEDGFWYYLQQNSSRNTAEDFALSKVKVGITPPPTNAVVEAEVLNSKSKEQRLIAEEEEPVIKPNSTKNNRQNLLVILVEFEDVKLTYSEADWHKLIFGETAPSLKNYYSYATNNTIGIDPAKETGGTLNDGIVRVTLDMAHPNTGGRITVENQKITRKALEKADPYIDYKQYDTNGNGKIEPDELHIMIIVAGQEQSYGNVTQPAVWGHRWALNGLKVTLDNTVLNYYTQFGEKHAARQATLGIIAHEFGHDLGLPDLYNTEVQSEGTGLGYTSLMASGSWGARPEEASGTTPVGLDAYSKSLLGMEIETISETKENKLVQSIDIGSPTVLKLNTNEEKEYFLIENREQTNYDEGMKRGNAIFSGGIAIYKINKNYSKNLTVGKQLVTLLEADEFYRGYSYYDKGGRWNADPFYYVGKNIHNKEQAVKLSKDTKPSTAISNGTKANFSLVVHSKSDSKMYLDMLLSEPVTGVFGEVKWQWDDPTQTLTFISEGEFPATNKSLNIESQIESHQQLNGKKIKKIIIDQPIKLNQNSSYLFSSLTELEVIEGSDKLNVSDVTDMSAMFLDAKVLQQVDVSNWNTSKVTNMNFLFYFVQSLPQINVSSWNTSSVTNMSGLFYHAESLQQVDVSSWDTSKVTNMNSLFYSTERLQRIDVSKWNTSNVKYMGHIFYGNNTLNELDLSNWDTSKVTYMSGMLSASSLDTVSLGPKSILQKEVGLQEKVTTPYTGQWLNNDGRTRYASSTQLVSEYDGSKPGTYTRERK